MRCLLMALWLCAFCVLGIQAVSAAERTPNILHIHADDMRPDCISALGHPVVKTPNIDSLVQRGLYFRHCYTQGSMVGAVCLPSRTMMLTGHSWLHVGVGAKRNGNKASESRSENKAEQALDVNESMPKVLSAAGYETWHVGKGGNEYKAGLAAFDTNLIDDARGEERRTASRRHADAAIDFLKQRSNDKPFYMYIAPPVPHDPRITEPEFMQMYQGKDMPLSSAFMPVHPFDNGEMTVRDEQLAPWPRTPENTRQQLAEYYACITALDHHVGRIFEQLKAQGLYENTVIIFTGDNGLSMGEHGLFGKQNLYEFGGMHVPLVIAGPGIPTGKRDALVYLMDLFPTLCDIGHAKIPAAVEGKSLLPVIRGEQAKVRSVLMTAYRDCQRSIRDDRWKLICYPQINITQLFDLQNDPLELRNLASEPEHAERVQALTRQLQSEMKAYDDHLPLVSANPKPSQWTPPAK